jgi:hypothetical protein
MLDRLHADDPGSAVRQVAVVDAAGRAAVYTGSACVREAGHHVGAGFTCQATMMISDAVPDAMAAAFQSASGRLGERLLAAVDAAEVEGGDVRGSQAAALLVVGRRKTDLRVDDHPSPLAELRRLHTLDRAYALHEEGEELAAAGLPDEAERLFAAALELAPESDEILFWAGVARAEAGRPRHSPRPRARGRGAKPALARPARPPRAGSRARRRRASRSTRTTRKEPQCLTTPSRT